MESTGTKCVLCMCYQQDDIRYGELLSKNGLSVHTFCLYLSSNLVQKGSDEDGLLGFLRKDILEESRRSSKLICFYCQKYYANIGCCAAKCRRTFHLICGIENGAENQFTQSYKSFCHRHVRKISYSGPTKDDICCICFETVRAPTKCFSVVNMIRAPCCKNGWFHKLCLQTFAKTAGYFFKCPLCNDSNKFREQLPYRGIFIPNRDAAWELEPHAYEDLLERPTVCASNQCNNENGRHEHSARNPLRVCVTCGSTAVHRSCMSKKKGYYNCDECKYFLAVKSNEEVKSDDEEEIEIDVCDDSNDQTDRRDDCEVDLDNANSLTSSSSGSSLINSCTFLPTKTQTYAIDSEASVDNDGEEGELTIFECKPFHVTPLSSSDEELCLAGRSLLPRRKAITDSGDSSYDSPKSSPTNEIAPIPTFQYSDTDSDSLSSYTFVRKTQNRRRRIHSSDEDESSKNSGFLLNRVDKHTRKRFKQKKARENNTSEENRDSEGLGASLQKSCMQNQSTQQNIVSKINRETVGRECNMSSIANRTRNRQSRRHNNVLNSKLIFSDDEKATSSNRCTTVAYCDSRPLFENRNSAHVMNKKTSCQSTCTDSFKTSTICSGKRSLHIQDKDSRRTSAKCHNGTTNFSSRAKFIRSFYVAMGINVENNCT